MNNIITIATMTGFFGDLSLQFLSRYGTGWGLRPYFQQHGPAEALCIASGMMALFYILYVDVLKLPPNIYYLALYGVILDLLFRKFRIFPSLDGYYRHLNYFWSAVWGIIPMIIPYLIYKYLFNF